MSLLNSHSNYHSLTFSQTISHPSPLISSLNSHSFKHYFHQFIPFPSITQCPSQTSHQTPSLTLTLETPLLLTCLFIISFTLIIPLMLIIDTLNLIILYLSIITQLSSQTPHSKWRCLFIHQSISSFNHFLSYFVFDSKQICWGQLHD